ncbi:MAG: glycogen synthase [Anaerolineae bacterium]|nr:glycogen synthase [Anaerolineae bacterium]
MNILFVAAECAPFVKVGGLGDVIGSLPLTLARMGHSVRVLLPHYGLIDDKRFGISNCDTFKMVWNQDVADVQVACVEQGGVVFHFIRGWPFFAPHEKFVYSHNEGIDIGRFLFFSKASLELVRRLSSKEHWRPDVYHTNDWHTGMVPFLLERVYTDDGTLGKAPTLFSIHNLQHQGWGIGWHLTRAGLPPVDHPLVKVMGKAENMMAIGLAYSTMLSTVSPRYAQEIATPEGGYGLDGLIHARLLHLTGILNGIDTERWNPSTSQHITVNYDVETLPDRIENKRALQAELGLPVRNDVPLFGAVMRLAEQKGPGIMLPTVRGMLEEGDAQFVLLGAGLPYYEQLADQLRRDFPDKAAVKLEFDELLAEHIYAGVDVFLMPSLFEPCGLGQMIAMRYGALPLVREVGGLADTVDPQTGFLFKDYQPWALSSTLSQVLDIYHRDKEEWYTRQRRAMDRDFSWERSAEGYHKLYQQTIDLHRAYA